MKKGSLLNFKSTIFHSGIKSILHFFDVGAWGALVILSIGVGLAGGVGAIVFHQTLHWVERLTIEHAFTDTPPSLHNFLIVLIPCLGGLIAGVLVFTFAPEAEGHGTDSMVRAFHNLRGKIRARVPFIKTIASVITIGTGGSAGKEGPIAQIGAGIGSTLGSILNLGPRRRRILMLAGASAGVGAIFRAPLGGALFAAEVLYREAEFEYEALVPSIVASITAYAVFTNTLGYHYLFTGVQHLRFEHVSELPLYIILGVLCALLGFVYVKFFYGTRDYFFHKLPIPVHLKPAVGGLLLGILALWLPQVLGGGYHWIQSAIDNQLGTTGGQLATSIPFQSAQLLILIALAKIVATSFTISSGGSGGVFGPSLFIGAMVGGGFGYLIHGFMPEMLQETTRESLILVGMGGFFSGVAKVPIASLIMVTEMTGSYGLIVPLMVTCTLAFVLSRRWTLYEEQVESQIDSPAHLGDFVINVLEEIKVRDVFTEEHRQVLTLKEDTRLPEIFSLVKQSFQNYYPVLNHEERLTGILSFSDVRHVLTDDVLGALVMAGDICQTNVLTTSLNENVYQVLRKMTQKEIDALPVVDSLDHTRMLGMLTRKDVIFAYDRKLRSLREESDSGTIEKEKDATPYRGDSVLTEIEVLKDHRHLVHHLVREISLPPNCLLISIQRKNEMIIPEGSTKIEVGDRLLVLTKRDNLAEVKQALTPLSR